MTTVMATRTAIGLLSKTTCLHGHRSRFFVHFLAVAARFRSENA